MNYQIVWRGVLHDGSGYARAGREITLALHKAGHDIRLEPVNYGTPVVEIGHEKAALLSALTAKPLDQTKPKVLIHHMQPFYLQPEPERQIYQRLLSFTYTETSPALPAWAEQINKCDGVLAACTHNIEAFRQILRPDMPITLVPHAADSNVGIQTKPLATSIEKDVFKFLMVGTWQHRKGPDVLLRAFWEEFTARDKVCLVFKCYTPSNVQSLPRIIRKRIRDFRDTVVPPTLSPARAPLYISTEAFSEEEMAGLYATCDAFVLPSRGEGWCLPMLEATAAGLPIIGTPWGGPADFLTLTNSFPVDFALEPSNAREQTAIAPVFPSLFTDKTLWAEPSVGSLREQMRYVFEHREEARERASHALLDMSRLGWSASAQCVARAIERSLEQGNGSDPVS